MERVMKTEAETLETGVSRKRRNLRFNAKEKSQAVLALWSGRRSASGLAKELGVPWAVINGWEKRALAGMLTALDPTWRQPEEKKLELSGRLERLLDQTVTPESGAKPESN
jgi:transposase-like protein